jgi:hypothetical protein
VTPLEYSDAPATTNAKARPESLRLQFASRALAGSALCDRSPLRVKGELIGYRFTPELFYNATARSFVNDKIVADDPGKKTTVNRKAR